jgi:hypothetical protein
VNLCKSITIITIIITIIVIIIIIIRVLKCERNELLLPFDEDDAEKYAGELLKVY